MKKFFEIWVYGTLLLSSHSMAAQSLADIVMHINNESVNAFSVQPAGNPKVYIDKLVSDLGQYEFEETTGNRIWSDLERPGWSDKPVTIKLTWVQAGGSIIFLIRCMDSEGRNLLVPGTPSQAALKAYFADELKE